jgi:hypothetical protein
MKKTKKRKIEAIFKIYFSVHSDSRILDISQFSNFNVVSIWITKIKIFYELLLLFKLFARIYYFILFHGLVEMK